MLGGRGRGRYSLNTSFEGGFEEDDKGSNYIGYFGLEIRGRFGAGSVVIVGILRTFNNMGFGV